MQVPPIVDDPDLMDPRIFRHAEMDLRTDLLHLNLPIREAPDAARGTLFLNFEKMCIWFVANVALICQAWKRACAPRASR